MERFGGIDVCVNNASAINLAGTEALDMKRYDLMQDINTRGTFVVSKTCIPHLKRAENPHVLTLSPPLLMDPKWFKAHAAYTIAKYGMSMCTLGHGGGVPRTTASRSTRCGRARSSRRPRSRTSSAATRRWHARAAPRSTPTPPTRSSRAPAARRPATSILCEDVLAEEGVTDFSRYSFGGAEAELIPDLFVE